MSKFLYRTATETLEAQIEGISRQLDAMDPDREHGKMVNLACELDRLCEILDASRKN